MLRVVGVALRFARQARPSVRHATLVVNHTAPRCMLLTPYKCRSFGATAHEAGKAEVNGIGGVMAVASA